MVGWHRHLRFVLREAGKRVEHNYSLSTNFSTSRSPSSLFSGKAPCLPGIWDSTSANMSRPFYHFLQQMEISSSRNQMADSSELKPVPSPLTPVITSGTGQTEQTGHTQGNKVFNKKADVRAIQKRIKMSPKKLNLVAALVRGMRVEDALLQMQVTVKRAAKTVYQVVNTAKANATHNHGLDPERLLVAEAFVGKGNFKKRVWPHAKGKSGIRVRPECRLTVIVREITPAEEAEIAMLKVHNFKKRTKRQRQLVPHKLIETTPCFYRKPKARSSAEGNKQHGGLMQQ